MYKVIVVDDEVLVREAICKKLDWEKIGFELLGGFENGKKAREFLDANPVDVVLTDICMPYMDGMELCRYLYENRPGVKIVILSGFDEFEYAKKAICYRAVEYLLKPVTSAELLEVLTCIKGKLDTERDKRERNARLSRTIDKNKIYMQSRELLRMLEGNASVAECERELEDLGISIHGRQFLVGLLLFRGEQSALFHFILYNMVEELMQKAGIGVAGMGENCQIFLLFQTDKESRSDFKEEVQRCIEDISDIIYKSTQYGTSIAVGRFAVSKKEISASYQTAKECIRYMAGQEKILWADTTVRKGEAAAALAMDYIMENYTDSELTLTELCSHFGVSVSRFSANFKSTYEETFMEALTRIRMEKAKQLLCDTDLKNYEIAECVGFADPHYFSVAFKKVTGMTPTEWGREHAGA